MGKEKEKKKIRGKSIGSISLLKQVAFLFIQSNKFGHYAHIHGSSPVLYYTSTGGSHARSQALHLHINQLQAFVSVCGCNDYGVHMG